MTSFVALSAILFTWAGAAIGGSLIAAPAKFTVSALDLPVALQIGRAQFLWVGYFEFALASVAIIATYFLPRPAWFICLPIAALALQWFVLMPMLSERSDLISVGVTPLHSNLHLVFIGVEVAKVSMLLLAGSIVMSGGAQVTSNAALSASVQSQEISNNG